MELTNKILCVDDEDSILRSLRRSFFDEDIEITGVTSGKEALKFLQNNEVDIVLSDYLMPEMTGWELLEELKKQHPALIRIMLSGYVEQDAVFSSLFNYTGMTFFSKPWDEERLQRRIHELLSYKKAVSQETVWTAINNGFPFSFSSASFVRSSYSLLECEPAGDIEKLVLNDCVTYLKLLHLAYSDFMNNKKTLSIKDLLDISGKEYMEAIITREWEQADFYRKYLYVSLAITTSLYEEGYRLFFNQNPAPLPDYVSLIQIDWIIHASLSGRYFQKKTEQIKKYGRYSAPETDVTQLVQVIIKLWHLPEQLFTFYKKWKAVTLESSYETPAERQVWTLKVLMEIVDFFIFNGKNTEPPSWWSGEKDVYTALYELMQVTMKSLLSREQ